MANSILEAFNKANLNEKKQFFDSVRSTSVIEIGSIASPITFEYGKLLTDRYLDLYKTFGYEQDDIDLLEKSVHFTKFEINRLLGLEGSSGIRVYFAGYPQDYDNPTEYNGRNTVVLRAVDDKGKDLPFPESTDPHKSPAENIGTLCPPKCNPYGGSEGQNSKGNFIKE